MKHRFLHVFVLCLGLGITAGFVFADEPGDLNCDFENGMDRWRGDGRLGTDDTGNRVCVLKKTGKRSQEITHKITLPESVRFDVLFRVRAMPGSKGVTIRHSLRSSQGAGFSGFELEPDGKWSDKKFSVKGSEGERSSDRVISIAFHEGEGVVEIDDIKIEIAKP